MFGRIGVFDFERASDNEFEINMSLDMDDSEFVSERLDTTINYAEVYDIIREVMAKEWLLLETVAKELERELTQRITQIRGGRIEITKLSVPIEGIVGNCGVEYFFQKKY